MKSLTFLLGLVPLLSLVAAKCECPLVKCGGTDLQICQCRNDAAVACFKKCGGPFPPLRPCIGTPSPQACGSRGLQPCPYGQTCVNNPLKPGCDIKADCPGFCASLDGPKCGGLLGTPCPKGKVCVDDPRDSCDPLHGGADCIGVCVTYEPPVCGGFIGKTCPTGLKCVDDPRDNCDPKKGGADCGGVCIA